MLEVGVVEVLIGVSFNNENVISLSFIRGTTGVQALAHFSHNSGSTLKHERDIRQLLLFKKVVVAQEVEVEEALDSVATP